jgi:hypothetical protein
MDKTTVYEMLGFVLAFLGIGIGCFAIHFGIRHDKYKRELEHKERMRALELGQSLPGDAAWLSPARLSLLLVGGVPIGIFAFASFATVQIGFHSDFWIAAAIVGLGSVVCGSVLAALSSARTDQSYPSAELALKPQIADDAYDVVSARG